MSEMSKYNRRRLNFEQIRAQKGCEMAFGMRKVLNWIGPCPFGSKIWSGPVGLRGWTGLAVTGRIWVVNSWSGERPQTRSSTRGWPGRSPAALRGRERQAKQTRSATRVQ